VHAPAIQPPTLTEIPHDPIAEQAVIGAAVLKPEALYAIQDLASDDFYLPANRLVLEAIRRVHKAGRAVDAVTVADELAASGDAKRISEKGAWDYILGASLSVPTAENIAHYAGIVAEKARTRRLIELGARLMARAAAGERAQDIGSDTMRDIGAALTAREELVPLGQKSRILEILEDRARAAGEGKRPESVGISTGLHDLDRVVYGIGPGDTFYVVGNPGSGKSALAVQMGVNYAMSGGPTLLFPLEMGELQVDERIRANLARVSAHLLKKGDITQEAWRDLMRTDDAFRTAPFYVDKKSREISQIEASCAQLKARHPGKLLLAIVDYAQLVNVRGIPDRFMRITEVSRRLKDLAETLEIAIVVVVQPNREGKKKLEAGEMIDKSDLDGAGSLENDAATIVGVLNKKGKGDQEADVELHALKSRHGIEAVARARWIGRWLMFTDEGAAHDGAPLGPARGSFAGADDF